ARQTLATECAAEQDVELREEELLLETGEDEAALPLDPDDAVEDVPSPSRTQKAEPALDATQLYLNEIGFSPLLTAEEEVYFARRAQRGDQAARARMIESNLRLVVKIARRDRKSTRLNSSHVKISYAVFCLKKKN